MGLKLPPRSCEQWNMSIIRCQPGVCQNKVSLLVAKVLSKRLQVSKTQILPRATLKGRAIDLFYSTDFRTQRFYLPNAAVHRQQGGPDTNGGRVADLWCDRGREWMAESQRSEHLLAFSSLLPSFLSAWSLSLLLHRQKQWIQAQPALSMLYTYSIKQLHYS